MICEAVEKDTSKGAVIYNNGNNEGPVIFKAPDNFFKFLEKNWKDWYNLDKKILSNIKKILYINGKIKDITIIDNIVSIKDNTNKRYYIFDNNTFFWEINIYEF